MIQFYFIDSVNKLRTYALRSILSGLLQNGVVQIGHSIGYAPAGCNIITIAFANLRQPHLMYSITAIGKGQMWRRIKKSWTPNRLTFSLPLRMYSHSICCIGDFSKWTPSSPINQKSGQFRYHGFFMPSANLIQRSVNTVVYRMPAACGEPIVYWLNEIALYDHGVQWS